MAEGQLDREYGSGAPYVLWVAMGMQENPDALKGPGTYNDYNLDTYMRAGYDSREAAEVAKGDIRQRFSQWREDPAAAVTFLKEKLLIQWIEPTYCSFNQTRYQYRPETWVEDLYTGQANERALAFLNRFQGMVYLAVFGYYLRILLGKLKGVQVLPGIIFWAAFHYDPLGGQEPLCVSLYRHDPSQRGMQYGVLRPFAGGWHREDRRRYCE